jgi:hypothetical protein
MYKNDPQTLCGFIKGRIVETIFRMMIEEDEKRTFTLIPFGYENSIPELAQFIDLIKNRTELSILRNSPDFVLMKDDKSIVYFVEVKYRRHLLEEETIRITEAVSKYWPSSHVFIATQEGFYLDSAVKILANKAKISKLNENIISHEVQLKYLDILKNFIRYDKSIAR